MEELQEQAPLPETLAGGREWVDIITDGSWTRDTAGRWAWIARPEGVIDGFVEIARAGGTVEADPDGAQGNNAAEIQAVCAAVAWARQQPVNAVIHTDSLAAVQYAHRNHLTARRAFPRVVVRLVNRSYVREAHRMVSGKVND